MSCIFPSIIPNIFGKFFRYLALAFSLSISLTRSRFLYYSHSLSLSLTFAPNSQSSYHSRSLFLTLARSIAITLSRFLYRSRSCSLLTIILISLAFSLSHSLSSSSYRSISLSLSRSLSLSLSRVGRVRVWTLRVGENAWCTSIYIRTFQINPKSLKTSKKYWGLYLEISNKAYAAVHNIFPNIYKEFYISKT